MLEAIEPFAIPTGLGALVIGMFWLVFTGRLIPASVVTQMLAVKDREIQTLEAGYKAEQDRNAILTEQVGELMELSRVTVGIVQAIPRAKDAAA